MAHKYLYKGLLSLLGIMALFSSCKTEHEDALSPYTEVESFTFENNNKTFDAVILGDSIVVYWLVYNTMPTTITPTINISKGAAISPKSGEPVSFSETTVYTVTAEDGTEKKYKLKPQANKPTPVISNIKSQFTETNLSWGKDYQYYMGESLHIIGQYFLTGNTADEVSVSLKQISNSITRNLKVEEISDCKIETNIPYGDMELDSGYYDVQILLKDKLMTSDRIWIAPTNPQKLKEATYKSLVELGGTTDEDGRIWFTYESDDYTMKYYPNPVSKIIFRVSKSPDESLWMKRKAYTGVDLKKEGNRFSACVPKGVTGYVQEVLIYFDYYCALDNRPAIKSSSINYYYKDDKGKYNGVFIYGTPQ